MTSDGRGAKCAYCPRTLEPTTSRSEVAATRDHYIPKSHNGTIRVWACRACNELKADQTPAEWSRFMADNPEWWKQGLRPRRHHTIAAPTRSFESPRVFCLLVPQMRRLGYDFMGVVDWMTAGAVSSKFVAGLMEQATRLILRQTPSLAIIIEEAAQIDEPDFETWIDIWIRRYGQNIEVVGMTEEEFQIGLALNTSG